MSSIAHFAAALRALPLHSFVDELPALVREHARLGDARVRLVDYPGTHLAELGTDDAVPITGSLPGAAYRERQPVVEADHTVHLPLLTRGECHGVLTGRLDHDPDQARLRALGEVADALADALRVAEIGTDQLSRARRGKRLTVAAEMQWELLPGRGLACAEFTMAGQLEPAHAVRGDNFDWSLDPGQLTLAVTNGMGEGLDAAPC
ncbi:hypothetical protein [Actinokineospora sp. NBRC 105648]|uniref:hypothetical protein n=1 Tax=Actinokineospora sp. NBRC 105648 TaxID=3032206 RepID=UPI0024A23A33|nr:hypothetical protein [Actinokineospora sp. NBRC 105648]GLZ40182.1 hypothetical protein Acsp05_38060 [Actinokineospora sp. NBRC 105648]